MVHVIHDCGEFVYLFMSQNLLYYQSTFNECIKEYGTTKELLIDHPIPNSKFNLPFSLFNPTHFLKSIRNNWTTEKIQAHRLAEPDTGKTVETRWKVLIEVYKEESKTTMKKTSFNYFPLFTTSFVKQRVCLALNTFNEKTSAELL